MLYRQQLQDLLGPTVKPCNIALYAKALTHKSAVQDATMSQERLEFLGDSVLSFCVTLVLYAKFPTATEGSLTKMRVNVVNGAMLAKIGRKMGLESHIIVGNIADNAMGHDRMIEDTFEALVGAVYLDQGIKICTEFIAYHIEQCVDTHELIQDKNYKDLLRNELQKSNRVAARYECTTDGDTFTCTVWLNTTQLGVGHAPSKKKAEMEAALASLNEHFPDSLLRNTLV